MKIRLKKNIFQYNEDYEGPAKRSRHHDSSCIEGLLLPPHTNSQRGGDEEGGPPWGPGVFLWTTVGVVLFHPARGVRKLDQPWGHCDCLPIPSSLEIPPTGEVLG